MPVLTKLQKNEAVSQVENRKLAEAPVLTIETLLNGKYFSKWETYIADHIYRRNDWIENYTFLNIFLLGRSKINNIVLGEDGFLLPFNPHKGNDTFNSEANLSEMAKQLKELQIEIEQVGGRFCFVGIPGQASIHRDKYPRHFQSNGQLLDKAEDLMYENLEKQGIEYINMYRVFQNNPGKEYYYRTDHHYNFEGAYLTYYEIIKKLHQEAAVQVDAPVEKGEMNITTLPNPFGGSRNKQIYNLYPKDEQIQLGYFKNQIPYEKYTNGKPDPRFYFYNEDPNSIITYSVYMGGDLAETVIKTNRSELPKLLIFGDSYTNAIEPLMYYHFNETRILDLRHYNKMSLIKYIDEYKPDMVIMVRDDGNYGNLTGNGNFKGENTK
jgi:hypothetical protein